MLRKIVLFMDSFMFILVFKYILGQQERPNPQIW